MAPSVWSSLEVQSWQESAKERQKEIREALFGNREYDFFETSDYGKILLQKKISFAVFGPPTSETPTLCKKKQKTLQKIFNLVCKKNAGQKSFRISFVCVECLTRKETFYSSVIRLHLTDEKNGKIVKSVFIDDKPRCYVDFDDYLANNRLPKCIMCYPATGTYYLNAKKAKLEVKFRKSPACNIIKKVLKGTDIASIATGTAAVVAGTACVVFAPIAIPAVMIGVGITGGTTALYTVGRSIETLVDRGTRGQTLSLRSPEARNCWMAIGGSVVCVASAGAFIAMRQAVQVGAQIGRVALQAPLVLSLSASGLGVVNSVANIVQKLLQGEPVSTMDLVYLVSASLMFANVVITTFKVNALLTEMSNNGIKSENFFKQLAISVKERPEFGKLVHPNQVVNLAPLGMFFNLPITKVDLLNYFKATCKFIVSFTKVFVKNRLAVAEYAKLIASRLQELWSAFGYEMQSMVEWFCKIKGKIALFEVFPNISLNDARVFVNRLVTMVSRIRNLWGDKNALERLASVIKLQEVTGTVQPGDGARKWAEDFSQTFELLKLEFERQAMIYQEGFETVKIFSTNLTENEYQNKLKITGPLNEYFWDKALTQLTNDFSSKASLLKLAKEILEATPGSSCLEDVETGTTVHFFHGVTPGGSDQQLSRDQYFIVTREKLGSVLDNGASLEIDLESRMGFFRDVPSNEDGIKCVIVKCVPEEGHVAGHIFVVRN